MRTFLLIFIFLSAFCKQVYTQSESEILALTKEILTAMKQKDYEVLSEYFHPQTGVRFSPYAWVDTTADIVMTKQDFIKYADSKHKFKWGGYDGSGDPIKLNVRTYFKKFVYDVDFLNAEKTSYNTFYGRGSTPDNLTEIYNDAPYTESYFSGFDEKYGGMDWRALKLVYKKYEGKYYLIAVIHSEWTI